MDHGSDEEGEDYPLLIEQRCYQEDDQRDGKSRTLQSYWVRVRQPSPSWIIIIYTCYQIIFGILAVPELNATFALICHQRHTGQTQKDAPNTRDLAGELQQCFASEDAQADLSRFTMYGQMIAGLLGAISSPILGSLSDRVGRKPILACVAIGPLIYEAIMVSVLRYPDSINMHWLLVGYASQGLSGSLITVTSTSQAYITDLVRLRARARLFSYLQAALSLAASLGPVISGLLLTLPNSLENIYKSAVYAHLSLILIFLFVLPESRSSHLDNAERDESTPEQNTSETYLQIFLQSLRSLKEYSTFLQRNIVILAGIDMFIFGILIGLFPLQLAYPAYLFKWQPTTQSFFTSMVNSWSILVLVLIFPMIMARVRRWKKITITPSLSLFNVGELGAIQASLALQIIGYVGIALARSPGVFIFSSFIVASAAPLTPLLTSCLTAHTPDHQSGQLLGFLSFLHAIARVGVPALLNATYSMTIGIYPAPLFLLLSIIIAGLLIASMSIRTSTNTL
ncbi:hypothetical protein N7478_003021 [Penicillium angulare]|uniref:uncharacterized protein n=1 Tax=Penicillium angulare TaxID=116970 RepID=UPI0025414431|nr:uncharacterized protein N7478_003021 [Penicillium angulare]KAJ5287335.1 hypothetical protein N7478_003021 [Penicillium angulare]